MVETGIFCTNAEVESKAGNGASTSALTLSMTNSFITQAESEINVATRYNWTDAYPTLGVDTRGILKKGASALAAIDVINYDLNTIGRAEAEDRINVNRDTALRIMGILRDKKAQLAVRDL